MRSTVASVIQVGSTMEQGTSWHFVRFYFVAIKLESSVRMIYMILVLSFSPNIPTLLAKLSSNTGETKEKIRIITSQELRSLEPAGSRGSWGLDDYFFLPFYWGSAQLLGQDSQDMFSPAAICDDQLIKLHMGSYMYFASISFITEMKGTPLSITAPLLYDISQLKSWSKINAGLLKMYQAEYLSSLPMMQHFLFGSILVFE